MHLAEGHAALGATGRLLGRRFRDEGAINLIPIRAAVGRFPLIRLVLRQADELQHFLGHRGASLVVVEPRTAP
jgi:hypothetical protein